MSYNYLLLNGIVFCLVNVIFLFGGSFLNVVVVLSIWKSSQLRKKLCYFMIFSLSCCDLLVVVVLHSLAIFQYISWFMKGFGDYSHQFHLFLYVTNVVCGCSLFGLLTMTLERYLGLAYPIFHKTSVTKRRLVTFVLAAQTFAVILNTIALKFNVNMIEEPYVLPFLAVFVFLVMVFNCKMFHIAKSRHNTSSSNGKTKIFEYKKYYTCLLAAILFFLCCCPIFVYYGLFFSSILDKTSETSGCLYFWASSVITMNSTVNAIIFFWINNVLRSEGTKLVKKLSSLLCRFL